MGCLCLDTCHTEIQRIQTSTKFVGPSTGHYKITFFSSVTKTLSSSGLGGPPTWETSHIVLRIDDETDTCSVELEHHREIIVQGSFLTTPYLSP